MKSVLCFVISCWLLAVAAEATVYYSDPVNGSMANDGSYDAPWGSFKHILSGGKIASRTWDTISGRDTTYTDKFPGGTVVAGDTIMLRTGHCGRVVVSGYVNRSTITVMAQPGQQPSMTLLLVSQSANWVFDGITISPELEAGTYLAVEFLVKVDGLYEKLCHSVVVKNCTAYSVQDASGWTRDDWNTLPADGANFQGSGLVLENCTFKNVNFGITGFATQSLIRGNTIENFAGDGMRALGNGTVFEYNRVMNCYNVNDNHDDGIQSWDDVHDIVLRGNYITDFTDPAQPFRGKLQGIGVFDGSHRNWTVENNLVVVDHSHGITVYGSGNSRYVNNTVIGNRPGGSGTPGIDVGNSDTVRNNLTMGISAYGAVVDHNITIGAGDYATYFQDYVNRDFRLKAGCPAIDSGSADLAPVLDHNGAPRWYGAAVDVGAFEYGTSGIQHTLNGVHTIPQLSIPNPLTLPALKRLGAAYELHTVNGAVIRPDAVVDGGVYYLVRSGGTDVRKTVVIR